MENLELKARTDIAKALNDHEAQFGCDFEEIANWLHKKHPSITVAMVKEEYHKFMEICRENNNF